MKTANRGTLIFKSAPGMRRALVGAIFAPRSPGLTGTGDTTRLGFFTGIGLVGVVQVQVVFLVQLHQKLLRHLDTVVHLVGFCTQKMHVLLQVHNLRKNNYTV